MSPRLRPSRVTVLNVLERGAAVLRRAGLGTLVDGVARRAAPKVGTFDVEIDGLRLHGDHIGQLYYVRELLESDREATFVSLLRSSIRDGMTIVEAGAHMGYVTLQAARAAGPTGRVFTFEANPRAIPLIERNLADNGLAARVTVVPLALADVPGRHAFYLSGGGDTSSLHQPEGSSERIEVAVTTLDAWLDPTVRVDVVKLDIEGAEVAALRGMSETLGRAGPALTVFAECNPQMLESAGSSTDELIRLLRGYGLDVRWIDEARGSARPLEEADWSHGYLNLCCRRAG
jgi:FkbM family methyltransferase